MYKEKVMKIMMEHLEDLRVTVEECKEDKLPNITSAIVETAQFICNVELEDEQHKSKSKQEAPE